MGQPSTEPLNEVGKQQVKLLKEYFEYQNIIFDAIYSSPYVRAVETAKQLKTYSSATILAPELREYSCGDWKGSVRSETLTPDIKSKMDRLHQLFQPPNGESLNEVQMRVAQWLNENILYNSYWINDFPYQNENKKAKIALVSHGMTIKSLLQYIMGFDKSLTWKVAIENSSVCKLGFNDMGWKVYSINDCSHLVNFKQGK